MPRTASAYAFEFIQKLGAPYYAFHDRDVAPRAKSLAESNKNLDAVVAVLKEEQQRTGIKLLWGTACLFTNPRFLHGAATSPNADVYAHAAAQVKKAMEVTHELGGEGYTFWGGREGYSTLWNTDMKRELDHLARFLHMAVDYKKEIGFKGQFYIEPKPKEPTTHQYDSDTAACLEFPARVRPPGSLQDELGNEPRHPRRPHHAPTRSRSASAANALGSIDANTGNELIGWDTDQFPTNLYLTTQVHARHHAHGTASPRADSNFDAKVRRESFEPIDLFYAHIGGMDAFARGLKIAAAHPQGRPHRPDRQGPLLLLGQRHRRRSRGRQGQLQEPREARPLPPRSHPARQRPPGAHREHHQRADLIIRSVWNSKPRSDRGFLMLPIGKIPTRNNRGLCDAR